MFRKTIEFSTQENYHALKEDFPIPAVVNIPEWFKKLDHSIEKKTVKGCMPFLDAISAGYILKMPQDFAIKHNFENNLKEKGYGQYASLKSCPYLEKTGLNVNYHNLEVHNTDQLKNSPLIEKNKNLAFHKILNPWLIKTPPGYSCLFTPIFNNQDDRFSPITAIVDTDSFSSEINFPIVINGDKYPVLDTVIKKGTPYVQVIPFKRENWKMVTKPVSSGQIFFNRVKVHLRHLHNYKNSFWKKKKWK
jgi:hypothetical protein